MSESVPATSIASQAPPDAAGADVGGGAGGQVSAQSSPPRTRASVSYQQVMRTFHAGPQPWTICGSCVQHRSRNAGSASTSPQVATPSASGSGSAPMPRAPSSSAQSSSSPGLSTYE